ncbi:hypothetical protein [Candidatus Odyssella thessalonicensis]|nr:hypothetical protein [Candidatus Odyssella thessalonicensis]
MKLKLLALSGLSFMLAACWEEKKSENHPQADEKAVVAAEKK